MYNKDTAGSELIKESHKFLLREEQLSISKRWTEIAEVTVHKEIFTEEKCIIVPVVREEIVIEKKVKTDNQQIEKTETVRIPINEECVRVIKHPILLEDVAIYKQITQGTKHINVSLKKEKLNWVTEGKLK